MYQPFIMLDCERMRHPGTGLYHYCLHLAKNLVQQPSPYRFGLYVPESARHHFAGLAPVVDHRSWHKFYMPFVRKVDLWHTTYQGSNYFPFRAKAKIVFTVHDLNFLYDESRPAKRKKHLRALQQKITRADAITVVSHFVRNDLLQHTDLHGKPVHVIYNGCNINDTLQPTLPGALPSAPFFFTIGTIIEKKYFHVLPGLLTGNDYQLVIAGVVLSEKYKEKIMDQAKRLNVADRLIFPGMISESEKYWYLQHCAAFAFPSLSEGFGLPVVEAMHFGKPLLLASATSLPEIGGEHAYYFENFDPEHMNRLAAKAISEHNPQKADDIRKRAGQFKWEVAARQYLQLYDQLLA